MQHFWHFNPIFIFSLVAKGPVGREEGKLSQPTGKYSQKHMSAILGNTNPPSDFSKVFWCKFIELITIIPDKEQVSKHNSK